MMTYSPSHNSDTVIIYSVLNSNRCFIFTCISMISLVSLIVINSSKYLQEKNNFLVNGDTVNKTLR